MVVRFCSMLFSIEIQTNTKNLIQKLNVLHNITVYLYVSATMLRYAFKVLLDLTKRKVDGI